MTTVRIGERDRKINTSLEVGDSFRLIGNATEFVVQEVRMVAGFIPSVIGVSKDGRYETGARIADTCEV